MAALRDEKRMLRNLGQASTLKRGLSGGFERIGKLVRMSTIFPSLNFFN
jgi:hypothetical protein